MIMQIWTKFRVVHLNLSCYFFGSVDHRSGFLHHIAGAPAAYCIAFFSLIRFKYGTLTHQMLSADGVVQSGKHA